MGRGQSAHGRAAESTPTQTRQSSYDFGSPRQLAASPSTWEARGLLGRCCGRERWGLAASPRPDATSRPNAAHSHPLDATAHAAAPASRVWC